MNELEQSDVLERLRWAFRRYAWLVAGTMAVCLSLGWYVASILDQQVRYQATALVVANTVEIAPGQLPRFAAAVFSSGAVAERVVRELNLGLDPRELIPLHVAMDPVPDSIALLVHGTSYDATESVELSNAAARHFVQELNRAGPGVGTFSIQDAARSPLEIASSPSPQVAGAASAVAGILLAVAMAALMVGLRRPLLTAGDAVAALGLPFLGTLSIRRDGPLLRSTLLVASSPLVMRALATRLTATSHDGFLLLGDASSKRARLVLVATLQRAMEAIKEPSAQRFAPMGVARSAALPTETRRATASSGPRVTIIEDVEVGGAHTATWGVVVVVERGTPMRSLSEVVDEWRTDAAVGVILLRRRRRLGPRPT